MEHGCTIIADWVIEIGGTTLYFESTGVDINLTKEQFEFIADWRAKLHLDSKNYIHDIYLDDSGNECMSVVCTDNSMLEIELLDKIRIEQKFVELVAMNKVIEYMIGIDGSSYHIEKGEILKREGTVSNGKEDTEQSLIYTYRKYT